MKVLIIEDEIKLSRVIKEYLEIEDFKVSIASDGAKGFKMACGEHYDVIVLDVMLPKLDGISLAAGLRDKEIYSPIIMLTAKDALEDKLRGLKYADDYLTKPFELDELLARIRSLSRRGKWNNSKLKVDDLIMDLDKREVKRAGKPISLTKKEFDILGILMHSPGKVISRPNLIKKSVGVEK